MFIHSNFIKLVLTKIEIGKKKKRNWIQISKIEKEKWFPLMALSKLKMCLL